MNQPIRMLTLTIMMASVALTIVSCQTGSQDKLIGPSVVATSNSSPPTNKTPAPVADVLEEALIDKDDLPAASFGVWRAGAEAVQTTWDSGPCGEAITIAATDRAEVTITHHLSEISENNDGFIKEVIFRVPASSGEEFIAEIGNAVRKCQIRMGESGEGDISQPVLPTLNPATQVFAIEFFPCCSRPLSETSLDPHEVAYIRQGDVIAIVLSTLDDSFLDAVLKAEQKLKEIT